VRIRVCFACETVLCLCKGVLRLRLTLAYTNACVCLCACLGGVCAQDIVVFGGCRGSKWVNNIYALDTDRQADLPTAHLLVYKLQ
jgi:hypothetical protein